MSGQKDFMAFPKKIGISQYSFLSKLYFIPQHRYVIANPEKGLCAAPGLTSTTYHWASSPLYKLSKHPLQLLLVRLHFSVPGSFKVFRLKCLNLAVPHTGFLKMKSTSVFSLQLTWQLFSNFSRKKSTFDNQKSYFIFINSYVTFTC